MRRAAQLFRDLEAARLRMVRVPRGRAKNHRADASRAARAAESKKGINGPHEISPHTAFVAVLEPTSYKRVMAGDEHHEWTTAIKQEIDSHTRNETRNLIPRQP
jgi:hypothetical protein